MSLYKLIFIGIFKDLNRTKQIPFSVRVIVLYTSLKIQCLHNSSSFAMISFPYVLLNCMEQTFISFLPVTLPYLTTSVLWFFLLCSKLQSLSLFSNLFWSVSDNKNVALSKFPVFILVFLSSLAISMFETLLYDAWLGFSYFPWSLSYCEQIGVFFLCWTMPLKKENNDFYFTLKVYLLLQFVSFLHVHH